MRANGAINVEIYVERDKGNIVGYRTTGMAVRMPGRLIKNNE